ncbi:MAG: DUF481 domain-containing protein [Acidobacteriota bacterium]|nr:DUF481 domain-containing protein [Acidobacteriota bacterium]
MAKRFWCCFLLSLLAALGARAQQRVEFTNGDTLSGKWVGVEGATIEFDSEAVGKVAIPAAKVRSFSIAEPLVVVLQGGKAISVDRVQLAGGAWTVEQKGHTSEFPAGEVVTIVPASTYRSAVTEEGARPWRGWRGNATFGYSLQNGDQNARTMTVGMSAVRRQPNLAGVGERWRTSYSFNLLFAHASSNGQKVVSNTFTTTLRQDYFFKPHNFLFAVGQLDHIQPQNLYLRQTYGGGFGRDSLSGPRFKLSLLGGVTFANEKFSGSPAEQFAEALAGERGAVQFNSKVLLDHSFTFYPNLSDTGQYRFDTAETLAFHLNSWLSANLGLTDFYISRIPTGSMTTVSTIGPGGTIVTTSFPAHNNNVTVTAGLGVRF